MKEKKRSEQQFILLFSECTLFVVLFKFFQILLNVLIPVF